MSWTSTRRFDRMFPGIRNEEQQYEQTLLAEWHMQAESQRKNKQRETSEDIWTILGTFVYDFEKGTEKFIKSENLWK